MIAPETTTILCRFVFDGAAVLLWGTSSYLPAAVPGDLANSIAGRLAPYQGVCVALLFLALGFLLPAEAAVIVDGWDTLDAATVIEVLTGTNVGYAWLLAATAAMLSLVAALLPDKTGQVALVVTSALLLASLAVTGHAAMHSGWIGAAHRINHVLHVLSGGAWLGALVPVLMILPRLRDPNAKRALMRFSTLGHSAVVLVAATGTVNTLLIVRGLPVDWSFPYQALLSAKIAVVAAMTALAVVNRYIFVPRLGRRPRAATALAWLTAGKIVLGGVVMALVAWFRTLEPR